ncbi:MAG: hypothetical protein V5A13_02480 [Haloarculaceae archaeon]
MSVAGRVVVALAVATLALSAASAGVAVQDGPVGQAGIDADSTTLAAAVGPDGGADWRVTYRIELDDQNATDAFESLRQDIEANRSRYVATFRERIEATAASAENATGREMSVGNFSVEVETRAQPDTTFGVVTYRFEWSGFAATDGDRIAAGDALDGLILDSGTALRVSWPDGYGVTSVTPDATEREAGAVVWRGPADFEAGEPRVTVEQGAGSTPTETVSPGGGNGGGGDDGADSGLGSLLPVAVLLLAALVVGGVLLARRGDSGPAGGSEGTAGAAGDSESGTGSGGGGDGTPAAPPEELLSNEERVLRLLEENGGRMKQQEVAEELDWTAAKTSQVVGDLRDEDEVESFRLGRENVLTLPDVDITGSDGDATGDET